MEEYSHSIMDNFSKLRLYLHQCREDSGGGLKERNVPVPPSKDYDMWQIFCLGEEEACGRKSPRSRSSMNHYYDISSSSSSSSSDEEMEEQEQEEKCQKTNNNTKQNIKTKPSFQKQNVPKNGYEPTTSLLCQFDQIIIRRVLHHHVHCISKTINNKNNSNKSNSNHGLSRQRGKWIYALLARLEKPLHRDEASSLMTLLRDLCRLRSELSVEDLQQQQQQREDREDIDCSKNDHDNGFDGTDPGTDASAIQRSKVGIDEDGRKYSANDQLAILNTLIVIVGIYFEQCRSLDEIMNVE